MRESENGEEICGFVCLGEVNPSLPEEPFGGESEYCYT
jgi:hypothetical protein